MYERNGIEPIVDNDWLLQINQKHIEKVLDHRDLRETTTKYHADHGKHRHELDNK